ncbi:MAG: 2-C-methyl-D-erythritol 2,4-cyclodiphosphate synthase [Candidatus Micrarchaeota archaeon]
MDFRIGLGQDSHRFTEDSGKPLILGGVEFEDDLHFKAHSDGDVVIHALMNALFSAIGGRSIGFYFSDTDERFKGADSKELLRECMTRVKGAGFQVNNVSISIECKKPKFLKGNRDVAMQESIARLLKVDRERVGITATSGEELTPFGKGEGIQVFCTILLVKH